MLEARQLPFQNTTVVNSYKNNITKLPHVNIKGVTLPKSKAQLEEVVHWANETGSKLHPVSRGFNWGFGSRQPQSDNQVVVDLSKLNRILEIDETFGIARIEAGVSQKQLADHLKSQNSKWYLDVTGSGAETSILGNAIERGIAYNELRVNHVYGFEVLLASGEWLRTGLGAHVDGRMSNLYPFDLGPGLDHLFFQSNYGIVYSATVRLRRKRPSQSYFHMTFPQDKLPMVIEKLREAKVNGIFEGIARTGDYSRSMESLAPLFQNELKKLGLDYSSEKVEKLYRKMNPHEWSSFGVFEGDTEIVKAKVKAFRKLFKNIAHVKTFSDATYQKIGKFLSLTGQKHRLALYRAGNGLKNLTGGTPSNDALAMAAWPNKWNQKNIDNLSGGMHFIVPILPFDGKDATEMVGAMRNLVEKDITLGITLNSITNEVIEAVISIKFSDPKLGHNLALKMANVLLEMGYPPYRLSNANKDLFVHKNDPFWEKVDQIKEIMDPNEVLSGGRYSY